MLGGLRWRGASVIQEETLLSKARRRAVLRIAQLGAAGLVLADIALYFAVVRPLDSLATQGWQSLESARRHVREMQAGVARLEKIRATLPETTEQLGTFVHHHMPPRRKSFSRVDRLVRRVSEQAGVQLADAPHYRLDSHEGEPFERMGMDLSVVGNFTNLLRWVHALETSSDFIVVHGFNFVSAEGGALQLRVTADLYLSS